MSLCFPSAQSQRFCCLSAAATPPHCCFLLYTGTGARKVLERTMKTIHAHLQSKFLDIVQISRTLCATRTTFHFLALYSSAPLRWSVRSLSVLLWGTALCKEALADQYLDKKQPPNAICDNEGNILSVYSKCHFYICKATELSPGITLWCTKILQASFCSCLVLRTSKE